MRRSVWWLWPVAPVALIVVTTLLVAGATPESTFERAWRTDKALDDWTVFLMFAGAVALMVGAAMAALTERDPSSRPRQSWPGLSPTASILLRRAYPVLIGITLFGYAVWLGNGIRLGLSTADVVDVLETQDNFKLPIKQKLETLPGITTLAQVAMPAVIVGVIVDLDRPSRAVRWTYRAVILLAATRAFLLAERLALAELLVPVLVLRAMAAHQRSRVRGRFWLALSPLLALVVLVAGFAGSEASRSWTFYSSNTDQSLPAFASERLLGYYVTAHNNGAILLRHGSGTSDGLPVYTTAFVWEVPPGSQLGGDATDDATGERWDLLRRFGNPEFNNTSGLASPFADYGGIGGFSFLLVVGFVIGLVHLSFLHGRPTGVFLYPILYTGLLEVPRYLYWSQGRSTPAIVGAVGLAFFVAARARRAMRLRAIEQALNPAIAAT
ncbi:MAG: oligosaccharide repeat unit polymerase [Acidimicrobiia bacterium]|nr:oligosaccharide repeat unit polymerase [Acidimicrobiia bacterium]